MDLKKNSLIVGLYAIYSRLRAYFLIKSRFKRCGNSKITPPCIALTGRMLA